MDYTKILVKPVITEKSTFSKEAYNQVVFCVADWANKLQVKKAVEEAFQVQVLNVNVIRQKAKAKKRFGRTLGSKTGYKKAYIQLGPGQKIEYFEGV
ncbi:MAG: 50S ribosomal protein L23 [Desulfohalobiaceae bacterium]|nr:50S ribosomal protein L23 [Desulfohalobiaceae bacterium]